MIPDRLRYKLATPIVVLRKPELGRLLDEWEAENGAFTEEELARARAAIHGDWASSLEGTGTDTY